MYTNREQYVGDNEDGDDDRKAEKKRKITKRDVLEGNERGYT